MNTRKRVLVIGDLMIDRYTYVRSTRKASEANIKVWDRDEWEDIPGGAANVAENVMTLDEDLDVTTVGLMHPRDAENIVDGDHVYTMGIETMIKHRYVDNSKLDHPKIVFRSDSIPFFSSFDRCDNVNTCLVNLNCDVKSKRLGSFDAVIFSDYDKGTLCPSVINRVRNEFSDEHTIFIVDSKRKDLSIYKDVGHLLKINHHEYLVQLQNKVDVLDFFETVIVTNGDGPTELHAKDYEGALEVSAEPGSGGPPFLFTPPKAKIVDVTGCGDTHTAALTVAFLRGEDVHSAIRFANMCASNVVSKFGTSVPDEIEENE